MASGGFAVGASHTNQPQFFGRKAVDYVGQNRHRQMVTINHFAAKYFAAKLLDRFHSYRKVFLRLR